MSRWLMSTLSWWVVASSYLVGGASRVAKSVLAQRLLETEGIPWLPTDVLPTVLRSCRARARCCRP
jgi:hypothetical protein